MMESLEMQKLRAERAKLDKEIVELSRIEREKMRKDKGRTCGMVSFSHCYCDIWRFSIQGLGARNFAVFKSNSATELTDKIDTLIKDLGSVKGKINDVFEQEKLEFPKMSEQDLKEVLQDGGSKKTE